MNVIVTGKGKSGSFKIRGDQLGSAMGFRVTPNALDLDIRKADAIILVKRPTEAIVASAHHNKVPIIWDVVDSWPQPHGNEWDRRECMSWLTTMVAEIKPVAIVAATRRMTEDLLEVVKVPVKWIPHHHRPGIAVNPIREHVKVIGYEGGGNYVSRWGAILQKECLERGMRFVQNSGVDALSAFDVVVGLRDQRGYAARHWKSNCKLANAHGSGTPFIGSRECGYLETSTGHEYWAEDREQLRVALDWLERQDTRHTIHGEFLSAAITIESVAAQYKEWLSQLRF